MEKIKSLARATHSTVNIYWLLTVYVQSTLLGAEITVVNETKSLPVTFHRSAYINEYISHSHLCHEENKAGQCGKSCQELE